MTHLNHAPILTADDEPTAKHDMAALTGNARASIPSMVPYPAPMVAPVARKLPLFTRMRRALAAWLIGDTWNERRVVAAAIRQFETERAWDRSDGSSSYLRAWKDSQLELEHATHALMVARGKK